jgi:acetyl-CoA carboxylase biotin carboxyl carrier protein
MNQKELKELIEFLVEKDISEFELERGDVKVRIKRAAEHMVVAAQHLPPAVTPALDADRAASEPAAPGAAGAAAASLKPEEDAGLHMVKSPIVGTFFESPSPGSPPFVKLGDVVETGSVLCIVEAMKLMNEIESDVTGEVVKKLVSNGQPVEYGQALFAIRPR